MGSGRDQFVLLPVIPLEPLTEERVKGLKKNECKQKLKEEAVKLYEMKEAEFPEAEQLRELERVILLKVIDRKGWIISTIWISCVRVSDCRLMGRGIPRWNTRWPPMTCSMK